MASYELKPSERQVSMVLDLNKCIGCQTCTVACKKLWNQDAGTDYAYWNNVETAPGKGYPKLWQEIGGRTDKGEVKKGEIPSLDQGYGRAWKFNHNKTFFRSTEENKSNSNGCGDENILSSSGKREWLRPDGDPKWGPNWDEDHGAGEYPQNNHYFYLPRLCNHCTHPACLDACPRQSIYKREEDGIVLVDQDKCHGYRFCVEACPYKKVYFDPQREVATKCIFCLPRVEEEVAPACARQCPGRLRFVGFHDDPRGPIHKLVHQWKVAIPLHPEFELGPNVFYVPPMSPETLGPDGQPTGESRIPMAYLEGLFGPAVRDALNILNTEREKRKRGEQSELMDLLIAYNWHDNFKLDPKVREVI